MGRVLDCFSLSYITGFNDSSLSLSFFFLPLSFDSFSTINVILSIVPLSDGSVLAWVHTRNYEAFEFMRRYLYTTSVGVMQVCVERDVVSCCEWGVCACVEGLKKRISRCSVDLFCPIFTLYSMSAMVPNAVAP